MPILEEHINIWEISLWGGTSIIIFVALFFIFTYNSSLNAVEAFGLIAGPTVIFFLTGFRSDIWNRPKRIEVLDDGVLLKLRFGRSTKIRWTDIERMNFNANPSIERKWDNRDVVVHLKSVSGHRPKWYVVYWSNAILIREKCKEAVGQYPPNWFDQLSQESPPSPLSRY